MTQGIKIWGPSGEVWMDSTLITWNLVGVLELGAGASWSAQASSNLADREFIALQIPLEVPFVQSYSYEKNLVWTDGVLATAYPTGPTLTISGGNQAAFVVVLCR